MRAQLAIHYPGPHRLWRRVQREDSLAADLADGYYSRQTPGRPAVVVVEAPAP